MKIKKINKNILVFGLGVSGMSLALLLKDKVENLFCWDDNLKIRNKAKQEGLNLKPVNELDFKYLDYLVLSPGINHKLKKPHKVVIKAKNENVKITTDIEFLDILNIQNFLIGITGTNGKSTTTKFIETSLTNSKQKCIACGNIGIPFSKFAKNLTKNDLLVMEVSSYQLDKIINLKFQISILLNLSKDHLDWHGKWKLYLEAKLRIFKNQDKNCFAVICIDDKNCQKIANAFNKNYKSKLVKISIKRRLNNGIFLEISKDNIVIINNLNQTKIFLEKRKLKFTIAPHNFQNLLATYASHYLLNKKNDSFLKSAYKLKNLEHRLELVINIENVTIFNDSKSTNINSAKNAIKSLSNVYWILGGRKKEGGINGVENCLSKILRAYTFGESSKEFDKFLKQKKVKSFQYKSFEPALENALKDALKENLKINILFSPACSSFDQFKNFEQRGKYFKKHLKKIIENE